MNSEETGYPEKWLELFSPAVREKSRFMALAGAVLGQAAEMMTLIREGFPEAYALDTAAGMQLDALGVLMNAPRPKPLMPDEAYRMLLRARMAAHRWDGTNESLANVLEEALPGRNARMIDQLDGSVSCRMDGEVPDGLTLRDLFPVPAGIRIREE
jgi:hypothetical protein